MRPSCPGEPDWVGMYRILYVQLQRSSLLSPTLSWTVDVTHSVDVSAVGRYRNKHRCWGAWRHRQWPRCWQAKRGRKDSAVETRFEGLFPYPCLRDEFSGCSALLVFEKTDMAIQVDRNNIAWVSSESESMGDSLLVIVTLEQCCPAERLRRRTSHDRSTIQYPCQHHVCWIYVHTSTIVRYYLVDWVTSVLILPAETCFSSGLEGRLYIFPIASFSGESSASVLVCDWIHVVSET